MLRQFIEAVTSQGGRPALRVPGHHGGDVGTEFLEGAQVRPGTEAGADHDDPRAAHAAPPLRAGPARRLSTMERAMIRRWISLVPS